MTTRDKITIGDFLTDEEITAAGKLFKRLRAEGKQHNFAAACDAEIIKPNIGRINKALGQENDSRYLAYAVEYIMNMSVDP